MLHRGRWSTEWDLLQRQHKHKHQLKHKHNPIINIAKQWTHHFRNKFWCHHNQQKHGKDSSTKLQATRYKLQQELTHLFQHQNAVLHEDICVFDASVEGLMERSITSTRNWLSCHRPLIMSSIKQAQESAASASRPITSYFSRTDHRKFHSKSRKHRHKEATRVPQAVTMKPITRYFNKRQSVNTYTRQHNRMLDKNPPEQHTCTDHPV